VITPFGLRHVLLLRKLQNAYTLLDQQAVLQEPVTPLQAALRGYLVTSGQDTFTYVLQSRGYGMRGSGFVQAKARGAGWAWSVASLGPELESSEDAATAWYRLLLHLCIAAGERGVQRLFACVPADGLAEEVFRQASFSVYTHEQVFVRSGRIGQDMALSSGVPSETLDKGPRLVQAENLWGVERLTRQITPRLVWQVEEPGEPRMDSRSESKPFYGAEQLYVLYGPDSEPLGHVSCRLGPRGSWVRILLHPGAQRFAPDVIDQALTIADDSPARPVYLAVREYQGGLQALLEERDLATLGHYSLLVKQTTVRVRAPVRKLSHVLEKRAEVAPTVSQSKGR